MEGGGGRVPKDNFVCQKGGDFLILSSEICVWIFQRGSGPTDPPPPQEIREYSVYNTSYIKSKVTWLKIVNSVDLSYQ